MLFMDYKLVPFNGDTVHVADVAAGDMIALDTTVTLPDEPGDHQVIALIIYDPYRNMTDYRLMKSEATHQKLVINAR